MDKDIVVIDVNGKKNSEAFGANKPTQGEVQTVDDTPRTLTQYIQELKVYMESIPGPHEGRIQELKDMIRKGKLLTKEAIRESAEKLAHQFLGPSN